MSIKECIKKVFTDNNTINESNIILFIATIMLVVIEIVALCKSLTILFLILVAEHLLFIFCMNKTENSKLDAKEVIKGVTSVLEKKVCNNN